MLHPVSIVTHSCAIATDLLVVALTWIKTYEIKQISFELHVKASLTTLLLRDGTIYFGSVYCSRSWRQVCAKVLSLGYCSH